jgi:hypothetical protein
MGSASVLGLDEPIGEARGILTALIDTFLYVAGKQELLSNEKIMSGTVSQGRRVESLGIVVVKVK